MSKSFVNLHTHSFYSLLQAIPSPQAIVAHAKKLNCPAVALTDVGVGYGLVDFYQQALKSDIKPILGAEVFVAADSRFERRSGIDGKEGTVVLLAQNMTGYRNLLTILSHAALEGMYYRPRADWELLSQHNEGLIALAGGEWSLVGKALYDFGKDKASEVLQRLQDVYGDRLYLEFVAKGASERQKDLNLFLAEQMTVRSLPCVVTSDARFLTPEDEEPADVLNCVGKNMTLDEPGRKSFLAGNYFRTFEEMEEALSYLSSDILEEGRTTAIAIAESVDIAIEFGQSLLPHFRVPEGETESSELRKRCEAGIAKRYAGLSSEEMQTLHERLDYELKVIGEMGFEAYFLIVEDFIRFAKDNGIAVGPGRGSAAGSLVSYLLEITSIDPLRYDLIFERFLNPERISMPDIDIDFSDERREEVVQYVTEQYGADKVSRVCTFGTMSAKAALKDVGRVLGVAYTDMNAFTKKIPNRPGLTLEDVEKIPECRDILEKRDDLKRVFSIAQKLEGCVRHVSVHACAVIIGRDSLMQWTPLQWAPGSEDVKITQFPYQQLEGIGLLKMDFLGLKNLSILEKTLLHIKATRGEDLNLEEIPIDDSETFEMMARGETTGVFQFESSGMRRYLRELKPTEFEDLVAMNALYRPGPMEYIPTYIAGKHKTKKVEYLHAVLEPILAKTYGIAVYQEQILKIAQVFAGFSLGQADMLRKAIGKKIPEILAKQREKFLDGAVANGHDKKLAVKMFDEIVVPFSGYGFNRSHAVCYARIAYETAYLRAHYPVEFMAAMMTTDRSNTDRIVLEMNECASMGIEVLPPSINQSGAYFTVITTTPDGTQETLTGEEPERCIRFGLSAIKGLGEETVRQIIRERKDGGAFESLQDFAKRVPIKLLNKKTLEALTFSGALDGFGDRKAIADSLDDLVQFARESQEKASAGQMGLFGGADEEAMSFALKNTRATKEDILAWERESLGLFVSDHPLREVAPYLEKYGTLIGTLTEADDAGKQRTLHGIIASVRKIVTRRGQHMAILQLEDTSGKIELAIFPNMYEAVPAGAFEMDAFVRARGKIEERDGVLTMIVNEIKVRDLRKLRLLTEDTEEEDVEESVYEIKIPLGTMKEKMSELKNFLLSRRDDIHGQKVVLIMGDDRLEVPFGVRLESDFSAETQKILS